MAYAQSNFTNEEVRQNCYQSRQKPTSPDSVYFDTRIKDINLNWKEKDLPQSERTKHVHGLHPYLGKYIPQIVEVFLRKYFVAGQKIFDPFSGSGTTLIQANELGVSSVGCDISEFNVLLARCKAKAYDIDLLKTEINEILLQTENISNPENTQLSLFSKVTTRPLLSVQAGV